MSDGLVVKVELIAVAFNPINKNYKVLLDGDFIPSSILTSTHPSCEYLAKQIVEQYLDTNAEWMTVKMIDCRKEQDIIYLTFSTLIPELIKNKNGDWIDMPSIFQRGFNESIQKIIFKAIRRA